MHSKIAVEYRIRLAEICLDVYKELDRLENNFREAWITKSSIASCSNCVPL